MANEEQLSILKQGVQGWNKWREENRSVPIDLRGANLEEAVLNEANFFRANLSEANLERAQLRKTNFSEATLDETRLAGADMREANLYLADLYKTDLRGADLTHASLVGAVFVRAKVDQAKVTGSSIYSINVWDLEGKFKEQEDLIITSREDEHVVTVDNIKVAQFVYLILKNEEIRGVIDTLTSKSVLILGRFALAERKAILDALKVKLREYDLLPIVFDFDRPTDKDFTETIKTLAGLSYFVIADITNPKSSPLELQATIPDYQIPFVPIIQAGEQPFAMMVDLQTKYNWVLNTKTYDSLETLISALKPGIIDPAIEMHHRLQLIKAQGHVTESLSNYLNKAT